jgi:hypothetical protein
MKRKEGGEVSFMKAASSGESLDLERSKIKTVTHESKAFFAEPEEMIEIFFCIFAAKLQTNKFKDKWQGFGGPVNSIIFTVLV